MARRPKSNPVPSVPPEVADALHGLVSHLVIARAKSRPVAVAAPTAPEVTPLEILARGLSAAGVK